MQRERGRTAVQPTSVCCCLFVCIACRYSKLKKFDQCDAKRSQKIRGLCITPRFSALRDM